MGVHGDEGPANDGDAPIVGNVDRLGSESGLLFEPISPHLEVADRIEMWIDLLVPGVHDQPSSAAREGYVDLMLGLADAAAAMREFDRSDSEASADRLRAAVGHLRRAEASNVRLSSGRRRDALG